jgi:hypothetical protein
MFSIAYFERGENKNIYIFPEFAIIKANLHERKDGWYGKNSPVFA